MKYTFLFLLSIIFTLSASAQDITVSGKLVSSDNDGLPYATISIAESSSPTVSIKKLATKENGEFSTTLDKGEYLLTFNFVGMDDAVETIDLTQTDKTFDIGTVTMVESSTELDELSVIAQRPLVKVEIDKLTYSAKDDPESSTSNVLDLLRKVPLVTVDGEDEIQLKGSSNFKIYINGKPSNMVSSNPSQVLKSMPANSVKDVEVITDPGAKYDAEGIGGIINIVTDKRVDDGYSGSVGANGDTFGGYGGNAYLATKYGKFGFSGNAGYYYHNRPESESSFIRDEFDPSPTNTLIQNGTSKSNGGGLFLSGNMSYEPDTLNLFNISASRFGGEFTSLSTTTANSDGVRPYSYITNSNSIANYGGLNFSADYQRSFKKKDELLTLSYRFENDPNDSEFDSEYDNVEGVFYYDTGYKLRSSNSAGGQEHTAQLDYVNPLNDKHGLEMGLKYIFRDNSSRGNHTYYDVADGIWHPDLTRKNDLDHKQNITSGYLGYSYKTGKVGFKVGLRGEHTQQDILFMSSSTDSIETSFFDMIPSATVSYQLGMTQNIRAGYNMRISRPGIWYLNPYINNMDPSNISYGNPNLDSEQQHNFNVNYGSFTQKVNFNATLTYSFAQNAVSSRSFIENGVTNNTYANIGKNQTVGTNIYVSWTPSSNIRTYLNGGMNYTDIKSNDESGLSNSGFSGRAFAGLTYTLPHDIRLGANGGLFMSRVQLQTTQSPFYYYSFSLMKSFFDKKLDLTLNVQDVFSQYREISSTTTGVGFSQKSINMNPVRNLRLSVTYRFGDLKSSTKRVQRGIVNEDVMQGESGSQQGATTSTTPEG